MQKVKVKTGSNERVAIFVSPESRAILNEVAEANFRGQRDQAELLFKEALVKLRRKSNKVQQ